MPLLTNTRTTRIEWAQCDPAGIIYYPRYFEIFDTSSENNRALLGGGRYDNLTSMFGGEPVSGIGFGMGDVTMRDFLETHGLLPEHLATVGAQVVVIPASAEQNLQAEIVAKKIRTTGISVSTDIGTQKVDKKKARAADRGATFIATLDESNTLTIKNLQSGEEKSGEVSDLLDFLSL